MAGSKALVTLVLAALAAVEAAAVSGYTQAWTNKNAAADGAGYISAYADKCTTKFDDFVVQCAASCDATTTCEFFNVYQELAIQPVSNICVLWYQNKPASSATNVYNNGKPISNSIGYTLSGTKAGRQKTASNTTMTCWNTTGNAVVPAASTSSAPQTMPSPVYSLSWSSLNAAADGAGYISSHISKTTTYDALIAECSAFCSELPTCVFFNVYQELQSQPRSNICVLWQQVKLQSSATNYYNNGKPISNSSGHKKSTPGDNKSSKVIIPVVTQTTRSSLTTSSTASTSSTGFSAPTNVPDFSLIWTSPNAAADGAGYIRSYTLPSRTTYAELAAACAETCLLDMSCKFINIYRDTDPSGLFPANVCVLWSVTKSSSTATNTYNRGRPIEKSAGYVKKIPVSISSVTTTSRPSSDKPKSVAVSRVTSSIPISTSSSHSATDLSSSNVLDSKVSLSTSSVSSSACSMMPDMKTSSRSTPLEVSTTKLTISSESISKGNALTTLTLISSTSNTAFSSWTSITSMSTTTTVGLLSTVTNSTYPDILTTVSSFGLSNTSQFASTIPTAIASINAISIISTSDSPSTSGSLSSQSILYGDTTTGTSTSSSALASSTMSTILIPSVTSSSTLETSKAVSSSTVFSQSMTISTVDVPMTTTSSLLSSLVTMSFPSVSTSSTLATSETVSSSTVSSQSVTASTADVPMTTTRSLMSLLTSSSAFTSASSLGSFLTTSETLTDLEMLSTTTNSVPSSTDSISPTIDSSSTTTSISPPAVTQVVVNPGFESTPHNVPWNSIGYVNFVVGIYQGIIPNSGRYIVTALAQSGSFASLTQIVTGVAAGARYTLVYYVKTQASSGPRTETRLCSVASLVDGNTIDQVSASMINPTTTGTGYNQRSVSIVPGGSTVNLTLTVSCVNTANSLTVALDDITFMYDP